MIFNKLLPIRITLPGCVNHLAILIAFGTGLYAQQIPDTTFRYAIQRPAYQNDSGPVILIDQAHSNFHTKDGGFMAFSRLLEQDGYRVRAMDQAIDTQAAMEGCHILVIANSLHPSNSQNWFLPTPSAFTALEISNIKNWVENGGSLFLIADHMPFAGAAYDLGKAFGFEFINGFAMTGQNAWPPSLFSREKGTLIESPVSNGSNEKEKIGKVATFTGSAFKIPPGSIGILRFTDTDYALLPDTAWRFRPDTPKKTLDGFYQGSIAHYGKGRVAVFGEAAMFTAQLVNGSMQVGFNSEVAPENAQFTLNLIHWLDGLDNKN